MRLMKWIKVMGLQLNGYHDLGILLPSIATRQVTGQIYPANFFFSSPKLLMAVGLLQSMVFLTMIRQSLNFASSDWLLSTTTMG